MRSRFTAFALHDAAHLARTWHPRTRPDDLTLDSATRWVRLEVLSAEERGDRAVVAFRARWTRGGDAGVLSERSRFERRARRWVYVDGDVDPA
jgi:SEC-C motif domain protein